MNNRDRTAPDPASLAAFVSEASRAEAFVESEQERHPLWQFPEEKLLSASAATEPPIRKPSAYGYYASLFAAILIAVVAGLWWGKLIPGSRPVATAASARPIVIAPAMKPLPDASTHPPAQLSASMEVRPSARPPMASLVPTVPREDVGRTAIPPPPSVAVSSAAATDQRQPRERPASMTPGTNTGAPPAPAPTNPIVATPPARSPAPAPEPPAAFDASPAPSAPPSRTPVPAARPEPEALPSVVARTEQSEIQRTLGQYRSAYQLLDAEAARVAWPSVDVRALARAFDTLTSQQLAFEACQFVIVGDAATAQCRGSATYTPKVGSRAPRLEPRQWTFHLRKVDDDWKIQTAQTRR